MRKALSTENLKSIYGRIAKRYDIQHRFFTAGADQRGRRILVANTVNVDDVVLDCGSGTGTTGIMAAKKAGRSGKVTLFDLSEDMLSVARESLFGRTYKKELPLRRGIWFICLTRITALMLYSQRIACVPCMIR